MKIGIDIDGCLNDVHHLLINEGIKWQLKNGKRKILFNNNTWDFDKIFTMDSDEKENFMNEKFLSILMNVKARDEAANVISKLRKENHKIIIVTNRPAYDKYSHNNGRMDIKTIKWLKLNKIEYDKIIFCNNKKDKVCLEENIDIMIEDMESEAKKISKNTFVLLFRNTYNNDLNKKNITTVYAWYDIYLKILNQK